MPSNLYSFTNCTTTWTPVATLQIRTGIVKTRLHYFSSYPTNINEFLRMVLIDKSIQLENYYEYKQE
jgi:hypothetical protein